MVGKSTKAKSEMKAVIKIHSSYEYWPEALRNYKMLSQLKTSEIFNCNNKVEPLETSIQYNSVKTVTYSGI